jgi:ribose transport system permease protein
VSMDTTEALAGPRRAHQGRARRAWVREQLAAEGFLVVFLAWVLYLSVTTSVFATPDNLAVVLREASIYSIVGIGTTAVVLLAELDISFGSVISLAGCLGASSVVNGHGVLAGLAIAVSVGVAFGVVNGLLVTFARIPSVVTTLATLVAGAGLAQLYTHGTSIYGPNLDAIGYLTQGSIAGIPAPALLAFVLYVGAWVVLTKTRPGAHLYATGDNVQAAFRSGINVRRMRIYVFVAAGALAGLAGLLQASRLGRASSDMGTDALFPVLTAVILGGVSIDGGRGRIFNTLLACLFLASITNGLIILGVDSTVQQIVQGAVLLLAVSLDRLRR